MASSENTGEKVMTDEDKKRQEFYDRTMGQLEDMRQKAADNPKDQMNLLRYAKGLVNTITIFGMSGDPEGIDLVLIRFREIVAEYGDIEEVQNQFSTALANSMSYLMKKQKPHLLKDLLKINFTIGLIKLSVLDFIFMGSNFKIHLVYSNFGILEQETDISSF